MLLILDIALQYHDCGSDSLSTGYYQYECEPASQVCYDPTAAWYSPHAMPKLDGARSLLSMQTQSK